MLEREGKDTKASSIAIVPSNVMLLMEIRHAMNGKGLSRGCLQDYEHINTAGQSSTKERTYQM